MFQEVEGGKEVFEDKGIHIEFEEAREGNDRRIVGWD